jgi:signal transduction histidine kinase
MFQTSRADEDAARLAIRSSLVPQHRAIDGQVSQFLIVNNQVQEDAARANRAIYDRVAREILLLVGVLLVVTASVGVWVIRSSRRAFDEVADMGAQLRTLSWRSLRVQEDVQRSISRELHDDFGQIVTAIGTLLGRAQRHAAPGSAVATELEGVRAIAQQALDRIRTRSHWLHPGVLDDFGLERAVAQCVEQFERHSGIRTRLTAHGPLHTVREDCAIHVYRIAQEALSNIGRHSGSPEAWVRMTCIGDVLELEIEDCGRGMAADAAPPRGGERGMGLVSMRERAELIGGELRVSRSGRGGVAVSLRVPSCVAATAPHHEVA